MIRFFSRSEQLAALALRHAVPAIYWDREFAEAGVRDTLAKLGWIEGRNLRIDLRWGAGDLSLLETHARELVSLAPDVARRYPFGGRGDDHHEQGYFHDNSAAQFCGCHGSSASWVRAGLSSGDVGDVEAQPGEINV